VKGVRQLSLAITASILVAGLFDIPVVAHEVTYQGTVLAVETTKLHVKTVDLKTKKEEDLWFNIDKTTKVKRGDKSVQLGEAKIAKGERIVVIVDHDAETKMLAKEIRLAGR